MASKGKVNVKSQLVALLLESWEIPISSIVFPFHTSYKSGQTNCKMYEFKASLDTVRIDISSISAKCILRIHGFVFCFSAALEAYIVPVDGSKCTTVIMENV